jgi:hypothetical protein
MAIYSDFALEDGISGQLVLWIHEMHPSSTVGTDVRHRGQRVMNGLVILHLHRGQTRTSRRSCSSRERTAEEVDGEEVMSVIKLIFARQIRR